MSAQKPMMPTAGEKYVPFKPIGLKDRRWPSAVITKPPIRRVLTPQLVCQTYSSCPALL